MATSAEISSFISSVAPSITKYANQRGFHIKSFIIAQACFESGYGTSYAARNKHNIFGIGPGMYFSSWDACCEGYFTRTVLGRSDQAKNATTLDQYFQAFVASGYLGGSGQQQYYNNLKSIIRANNLTKYDNGGSAASAISSTSNKLNEFLNEAKKHLGEDYYAWVRPTLGKSGYEAWCADFIWACAKTVGIEGTVISGSASAQLIASQTAERCGGTIHSPNGYTPMPGDIVNFVWHGGSWADHVGIVESNGDGVIHTIEGNTSGHVNRRDRPKNNTILRYCSPDWSKVGGYATTSLGDLYGEKNTREDAIIREVAYVNTTIYAPTIAQSKTRLSLVNYTELFESLWDAGKSLLTGSSSTLSFNLDDLDSTPRAIVEFFNNKGLNAAAGCGMIANMYHSSNLKTSYSKNNKYYGICSWSGNRAENMKRRLGSNWSNNLTGQLNFIWDELSGYYKQSTLNELKKVPANKAGAKLAADIILKNYIDGIKDITSEGNKRRNKSGEYWDKIAVILTAGSMSIADSDSSAPTTSNDSSRQQKVVNACRSTPSPGAGWCAAWVSNVFRNAGIGSYGGNANDMYWNWCNLSNKSQIKTGMIVAVSAHNHTRAGSRYGHVGIYVGNGNVMHNIGNIATWTLDKWVDYYNTTVTPKWGWIGGVDLSS